MAEKNKITAQDIQDTLHLSGAEAARVLGVNKSSVNRARNKLTDRDAGITDPPQVPAFYEQRMDGTIVAALRPSEGPQTLEDALELLASKKVDISAHSLSYGFVERELASGKKTTQLTIRAVPNKAGKDAFPKISADELIDTINGWDYSYVETSDQDTEARHGALVICPSDMQIGKTSFHGGTKETLTQVMGDWAKAADLARKLKPAVIVIAELGDPIENFYSTSSQRETNDLDLTSQVRTARRLLIEGIKTLAPLAPRLVYATVPSNHGSVRVGFKAPAGDNHNDWGLEILEQLRDVCGENPTLAHVEFVRPAHLYESLSLEVEGTKLGMVHGHQSKGAEKLGEWWKGQDHGRQPTWDADILLAGHWHSFRVQQSGNGRWVLVSPASDPGSDWFTNITGEWSQSGMLMFSTENGAIDNLVVPIARVAA